MPSSKDKTSESDGKNTAEDNMEQNTIEFPGAKAESPDAIEELNAAGERLLRLQAEMQNLRNRTSREIADERKYAALPVMRDPLPVVDNIDRAIEAAEKTGEAEKLLAGFRLVKQQLHTILSRNECVPIAADNAPFDPNFHQAIL